MAKDSLRILDERTNADYAVPVNEGAIRAMDLRQIKIGTDDFGLMTYDPAFMNTASCRSAITFIDGDKGILRYRGYPIEQLAHGQKVRSAPRQLLARVPGLKLKEMRLSDLCCGSAGIYNVIHTDMSMRLLANKMENVNTTGAERIATANPGCSYNFALVSSSTDTASASVT